MKIKMSILKKIFGNKIRFRYRLFSYHSAVVPLMKIVLLPAFMRQKPARAQCDGPNDISIEDNARWLIQISNFPNDIAAGRVHRTGITILHCGQSRRTSRCTRFVDESSKQIAGIYVDHEYSAVHTSRYRGRFREANVVAVPRIFAIRSYQYATLRTIYLIFLKISHLPFDHI